MREKWINYKYYDSAIRKLAEHRLTITISAFLDSDMFQTFQKVPTSHF